MNIRIGLCMLLVSALASGCLHYEEEIALEPDGSGTVLFHYWVNETSYELLKDDPQLPFTEERAADRMESEHVKLGEFLSSQIGEDIHFNVSFSFDDVRQLGQTGLFESEPVKLEKDPNGLWAFERTIKGSSEPSRLKGMPNDRALKEYWSGYEMKFIVHFPGLVLEANTKKIKQDTATWIIPLTALTEGKQKMRATYQVREPRQRKTPGLKTALRMGTERALVF